ncbi:hypothetical protein ScPMuIL_000844 [Solemya velum]
MAESASSTAVMAELQIENKENQDTNFEPEKKRVKLDDSFINQTNKLEDRLCGILCCAVCLDLPRTCFQIPVFQWPLDVFWLFQSSFS